jgi:uncharacterized membrane protein
VPIIHASTHIGVPVSEAFAYAADYRNATSLVQGLKKFEPVGRKTQGKGARFAAVIEIASKRYESVLAVTIYEPDKAIGWEPETGGGHSLVWRFEPDGDSTSVDFELGYKPPGGVAGALLGFTIDSMLRSKARGTAAALKRALEP